MIYSRWILWCLIVLSVTACATPRSAAYREFYAHLREPIPERSPASAGDNFLIIFVDAPHLDYTDNVSFFKTVAKHPRNGSKSRDVGHAWIYLQGVDAGQLVYVEGGHSGERGVCQAKYFDGIMNYIDFGYANPTNSQLACPCWEPNPIKYLWEAQHDGYFEWGPGRHRPSFAARMDLSDKQFSDIMEYVSSYNYREYSLTGNQCTSFVQQVASLAGLELDCEVTIPISPSIYFNGERIRFWEDPFYSNVKITTPDILERSLMQAVREGKVQLFMSD